MPQPSKGKAFPMTEKSGWFQRLKQGLSRSSSRLTEGLATILVKRKLDQDTLGEIEELLIAADLGKSRFGKEVTDDEVRGFLADRVAMLLAPVAVPLDPAGAKPFVILVV